MIPRLFGPMNPAISAKVPYKNDGMSDGSKCILGLIWGLYKNEGMSDGIQVHSRVVVEP